VGSETEMICYVCLGEGKEKTVVTEAVTIVRGTTMCVKHAQEEWLSS
jgi:hypothetical protein